MTEPTNPPQAVDVDQADDVEPAERLKQVYVILAGGRPLNDRHYKDANKALDDMAAAAVPGCVIVPVLVPNETDE